MLRARALVFLAALIAAGGSEARERGAAEVVMPAVVAAREAVQAVVSPSDVAPPAHGVHPDAVALIVRWEIGSAQQYERRYQRPIWPGGASGVTIGVGYDLGHQTRAVIMADWLVHPQRSRLPAGAGIVGMAARPVTAGMQDVLTPWQTAEAVFVDATLPVYEARARRAFAAGWERLPPRAAGALVSVVYNRGASMNGDARREMRVIRDECVPASDVRCIGAQIRSMCRLWVGTPNERGLCARRDDEARLAEGG